MIKKIIHYIKKSLHCRSRKLGLEGRNVAGMGFYFFERVGMSETILEAIHREMRSKKLLKENSDSEKDEVSTEL